MKKITHLLGWTHHSYYLLSAFILTCVLIVYIWWPLVDEYISYMDGQLPWYMYMDWLLLGIFLFMSLTIMAHANFKVDFWIIFVGMFGGLVIESWGTQTNLWHYYTTERPPLWILPAWPIASLSIDRITRALNYFFPKGGDSALRVFYWLTFGGFYILMLWFVSPTFDKPYTMLALIICGLMILTPPNIRTSLFVFVAGSGLGYFLELWGTTRECWIYYTGETPPLFAVLAHGMAALAFWRTGLIVQQVWQTLVTKLSQQNIK